MKTLSIDIIKEKVTPVCQRHGVKAAYLFGSYARGEATENSDVDIRIEGGKIHSLFELSAFRVDLVEALEMSVDIISALPDSLTFRKNLQNEEVLLYAA